MAGGLPKRILSIQGGGVRVASTVGYLERLERLLQARYGDADFRLSDYYDLIGGLSSSSILALELARRRSVAEASATLRRVLEPVLRASQSLWRFMRPESNAKPLREVLEPAFGDIRLDDASFATGFALITTSLASTRPTVICNHPALVSTFGGGHRVAGVAYACLARPGLFPPADLRDADDHQLALVAGEASIGSDPSLALMLLATSPRFPLKWRIGEHRLCLTAVGYKSPEIVRKEDLIPSGLLQWIPRLVESLTVGAEYQSRSILEALAIGDAAGDNGLLEQSATLTYRRYEPPLGVDELARLGLAQKDGNEPRGDDIEFFDQFVEVGRAAAAVDVLMGHLPDAFDVRSPRRLAPDDDRARGRDDRIS